MAKKLDKELQKLEDQVQELTRDLKRVQADFVNFRRRSEEEQTEIMKVAKKEVVAQLLPIFDNIERALGHVPKQLSKDAWAQGVARVAKQAEQALAELGIEKIKAKGQEFDHNLHEAVGMENGDGEREVVSEELQTGYRHGDEVIRPAMVKVRKEK
jgi:molecular chaperone GrpE